MATMEVNVKYDKIIGLRENDVESYFGQRVRMITEDNTTQSILTVPMPDGSVASLTARVTALQTGGTAGNIGDFYTAIIPYNGGINGANVKAENFNLLYQASPGINFGISVNLDTATNTLSVDVTGQVNKTISWVLDYELNVQMLE